MLKVILPDGSSKEFPGSVPVKDVAGAIGPRLLKAAIAAEVDGKVVGLRATPGENHLRRAGAERISDALPVLFDSATSPAPRPV